MLQDVRPTPRKLIDPLGFMQNEFQIPVTTGTSGNCTVVICPQMMAVSAFASSTTTSWLPFASTSASNTGLVYNGATTYLSPYAAQLSNIVGWLPDQAKTSFVST